MTPNHSIQVWRADGGVVNDLTEPREGKAKCLLFSGGAGWGVWRWESCKPTDLAEPLGGSKVGGPDTTDGKAGG